MTTANQTLNEIPNLTGQVALVTGGGTGVGRATSVLLAKLGVDIVVNYSRSVGEAQETVAEIQSLGRNAIAVAADVSSDEQVRSMFARTKEEFGRRDILINNAGMTHPVPATDLEGMTEEKWDEVFAVNVKGTFFCSRAAIALMRSQPNSSNGSSANKPNGPTGQVINVSSIAAITGLGSSIAYAASKAAISNMTKSMAISQAPDIRINAVAPGVVMTRWVEGWEIYTDPHRESTPMKRLATAADVARAIYA